MINQLINENDLIQAARLDKFKFNNPLSSFLMNLLSIDKLNDFYSRNANKDALSFIDSLFKELNIDFVIDEKDLDKLPKDGAFITVSNHPFGGIEGLFLIKLLFEHRNDAKITANFLLQRIEPIQEALIPLNPFENKKELSSNYSGLRKALEHLKAGHPLGTFPAGEVSCFKTQSKTVTDREWQPGILKMIQHAQVPVVPIYFNGQNSLSFQILSSIHPGLRTAKLPSELFNKKNKTIRVRIGSPVSTKELSEFNKPLKMGRFLRAKTYALGSPLEVKKFFKPNTTSLEIAEAVPTAKLIEEIEILKQNKKQIHSQNNFETFIASSNDIPNILTEIGRLREVTFRSIEEGTNRNLDLDEYDLYYQHLFIWDKDKHRIVGAYRLGKGRDIMNQYGKRGFYTNSLFRFKKDFNNILENTIELGRSFIVEDYQKARLPLFILWKGILYFLLKNPDYRYLLGPVTISNRYSKLSRALMVGFIKNHFYKDELAKHVKPRKRFRLKVKNVEPDVLLEYSKNNFLQLDKFIQDIEPNRHTIPVLLKKYMKQNARIIGFNIDPKFESALDGLMILDLKDVPQKMIDDLKKDFEICS
ncbi:lysophospholipid acyltransferase family protein [Salibacter halophilus]|uniref:Lysophospholipid acyltransferase family protein n=1 Tax=Salibacter halophilus TaxID=1803916 RepID=A0A6N6M5G1_9FLAO|nr:lysophospholipid acyltransferase family protein [Salibacter halophilus]KAB1064857.1 lysophospholipid acyltransferase family protein [Salibacter halophilus]